MPEAFGFTIAISGFGPLIGIHSLRTIQMYISHYS
jgi:hypothetical protein